MFDLKVQPAARENEKRQSPASGRGMMGSQKSKL
jgi:hypothetical protein